MGQSIELFNRSYFFILSATINVFKEVGKGSQASGDTYIPVLGPPESRATVG